MRGAAASRHEVYAAIDSERDFQNKTWNKFTTKSAGAHTPAEFALIMKHYIDQCVMIYAQTSEPLANNLLLENIRKITALGVNCMEQNGAPVRIDN
jgi:hypothetical protein